MGAEFVEILTSDEPAKRFCAWAESIMNAYLDKNSEDDYLRLLKDFALKWTYFTSLVLKELTIKSSKSFGEIFPVFAFAD